MIVWTQFENLQVDEQPILLLKVSIALIVAQTQTFCAQFLIGSFVFLNNLRV